MRLTALFSAILTLAAAPAGAAEPTAPRQQGDAQRRGGDCTSGQALTGGSQLNAGSWIFMLAVFAGAYALAWFVRKEWRGAPHGRPKGLSSTSGGQPEGRRGRHDPASLRL